MNYHAELLKAIPSFFGNYELTTRIFNQIMVASPKAVIDALATVVNPTYESKAAERLASLLKSATGSVYPQTDISPILDQYKNKKVIGAIEEIRNLTHLGLKETKQVSDAFKETPEYGYMIGE